MHRRSTRVDRLTVGRVLVPNSGGEVSKGDRGGGGVVVACGGSEWKTNGVPRISFVKKRRSRKGQRLWIRYDGHIVGSPPGRRTEMVAPTRRCVRSRSVGCRTPERLGDTGEYFSGRDSYPCHFLLLRTSGEEGGNPPPLSVWRHSPDHTPSTRNPPTARVPRPRVP